MQNRYKYYADDETGVLIRSTFNNVDVYNDSTVIETLHSGDLLVTIASEEGDDSKMGRWNWYGDRYDYVRVITPRGQIGWVLRSNIGKVEDDER